MPASGLGFRRDDEQATSRLMTETDRDLLPEGLEDRLTISAASAARVTRAVIDVMDSHGYDRVQPPSIEFEKSLASRMAGISPRRMFRFVDPASLRMMALRSDITPQVGRIAATGLAGAARPLRLCYAGQVVTIKGDGLDPTRERLQLGAELIGSDSVTAAAEMVALAVEAAQAAGATGISVDFTLPDLVDMLAQKAMPLDQASIAVVRRELDAKDAGGLVAAGGEAYLPLLSAMGPFDEAIERLAAIDAAKLQGGGALSSRIAALREVADRILGASGSEGEPAIGFSLYPDELIDSLGRSEPARDTLFLPLGHDANAAARLRAIGWRTVAALCFDCDPKALGCTHRLEGGEALALEA
jgi:ATP phosphoribosyltransferase regulatory subunit